MRYRLAAAVLATLLSSAYAVHAERAAPGARATTPAYASSGADQRRTGRSSARAPSRKPKRLWTARLSGRGLVPPAILGSGLLLVGSRSGLHAIDPASGAERWVAPIGAVRHTPAVLPGDDVIAIGRDRVYRVGAAGAAVALRPELSVARVAPMLEGERVVLVASFVEPVAGTGPAKGAEAPVTLPPVHLVALSVDGGLLSATAIGIDHPRQLAGIAPGLALIAGRDALVSRAPTDGFGARTIDLGDAVASIVIGDRGETFAITESDQLIVLEPSGRLRPVAAHEPRAVTVGPALGRDGGLRIGLESGEIVCLEPDGAERWRRGLDGRPGPILLDRDDTALFATSRGTLYAIDAGGELRWLTAADALRAGRPVLGHDGTLYIVYRGGLITAYR